MNPLLSIGIRNVRLNWRHSLASLLSIMAGFFALNIFQGYIHDLSELYLVGYRNRSSYGDILVVDRKSLLPEAKSKPHENELSVEIQNEVRSFLAARSDQFVAMNRFLFLQGMVTNGKVSTVFIGLGSDSEGSAKMRGDQWRWNVLYGEPLNTHPEGGRALLGMGLARTLGCLPDPQVDLIASDGWYPPVNRKFSCSSPLLQFSLLSVSGQISALDLEAGGLVDVGFADLDRRFVYMRIEEAQTLLNTDRVSMISLMLKDPSRLPVIKTELLKEVGARHPELTFIRWQDHPNIGDLYNRTMDILRIFRNFVVIVIIAISGLSVLNTMTKNITERTREIGTLMGLGFRKSQVRTIFMVEAATLGLVGISLGGALSLAVAGFISKFSPVYKAGLMSQPVPFRITLTVEVAALGAFGLIALVMVATALACRRALRKSIVECLHHF